MKAVNRHEQATERQYHQSPSIKLTQQEKRALSLVWSEPESAPLTRKNELDIEHCAVLGYN